MSRPPHLCSCGLIVAYGARCICQRQTTRERNARHDARRPSARERGYDAKWDRERAAYLYLHRDGRMCGREATTVDHIFPHRGDRSLFWNRSNWQPLCTPFHNSVKQRQERAQRRPHA